MPYEQVMTICLNEYRIMKNNMIILAASAALMVGATAAPIQESVTNVEIVAADEATKTVNLVVTGMT